MKCTFASSRQKSVYMNILENRKRKHKQRMSIQWSTYTIMHNKHRFRPVCVSLRITALAVQSESFLNQKLQSTKTMYIKPEIMQTVKSMSRLSWYPIWFNALRIMEVFMTEQTYGVYLDEVTFKVISSKFSDSSSLNFTGLFYFHFIFLEFVIYRTHP